MFDACNCCLFLITTGLTLHGAHNLSFFSQYLYCSSSIVSSVLGVVRVFLLGEGAHVKNTLQAKPTTEQETYSKLTNKQKQKMWNIIFSY